MQKQKLTENQEKIKNIITPLVKKIINERHKQLSEVSPEYSSQPGKFEIGDIVGNTVQGFNFKVLKITGDSVIVKNLKNNTQEKYYIYNFYKST